LFLPIFEENLPLTKRLFYYFIIIIIIIIIIYIYIYIYT